MKDIEDIHLGYRDAENYRRRENKELQNSLFIRTPELEELRDNGKYFLVGEKGTGKTAFAVYLSNNEYRNIRASLRYIRETEYDKFLELKRERNLTLSDYANIWKIILYLLLAEDIIRREGNDSFLPSFVQLRELKNAIDEYYESAFSPEIIYAIQFVEESERAAELLAKHINIQGARRATQSFSESRFQTNLLFIQKQFERALSSLKLAKSYVLFIDGIDIRPDGIPYSDYLNCIKGLANAVWSVNNDFFSNVRDSKGRLRSVLLVRPDILDSLNLQNTNSKVRDNSVILNWLTTYPSHRNSKLFALADRLLASEPSQAGTFQIGDAWDYYFPFNASNVYTRFESYSSFITVLRYSLYRPRDVLTILGILQENIIETGEGRSRVFSEADFSRAEFTRKYSDYLLGEVKDHLSFYYRREDYEVFLKFFQYLNGRSRFSYDEFLRAFLAFEKFLQRQSTECPQFCTSADEFLQFIYELNVVAYVVDTGDEPFFGYCFRERSPSNISPKVRTHVRYDVHYGLMKALDLGRHFETKGPGLQ